MSNDARPKDELFEQFARVGKALASPKRLEMLDVLAQGERSVEVLAQATDLKLTTASAHLQTLRRGGLVQPRKEGTKIFYRLASNAVARLFVDVRDVAALHLAETSCAAAEFLGEDSLQAIDRDTLLDRIKLGNVVLLDVRPEAEFAVGHIDGAISVPLDQLYERVAGLPDDLAFVAYCRGEYCVLAYEAVRQLRAQGREARRLQGGMLEWRLEERPTAPASA